MQETALIEWCEPHNAHSAYITEYYNSWSNVFFILSAIASYWSNLHTKCNMTMCIVGLGSFWFHATQSYIGELFDELPMSLLMYFYYEMSCINAKIPVYKQTYFTIATIGWSYYIYVKSHIFFTNMFTIQLLIPIYIIVAKTKYNKLRLLMALCSIVAAKIAWKYERYLFETNRCPTDETSLLYYLHSFWHFGAALAHYFLVS